MSYIFLALFLFSAPQKKAVAASLPLAAPSNLYLCTEVIPLQNGIVHMVNQHLDQAVNWDLVSNHLAFSNWSFTTHQAPNQKLVYGGLYYTRGLIHYGLDVNKVELGLEHVPLFKDLAQARILPVGRIGTTLEAIEKVQRDFQVFKVFLSQERLELVRQIDSKWHDLASTSYVLAGDRYAIWLSRTLRSLSYCAKYEAGSAPSRPAVGEARDALFKFFVTYAGALKSLSCADLLVR